MNPSMAFWVPAALRLLGIAAGAGLMWALAGAALAVAAAFAGLLAMLSVQWHFLFRLSTWLDHPECARMPRGRGTWEAVFSGLYRLRRDDERNRAELAEWLARFRQAMTLLPDGVVIMNEVLTIEWCNPAAEQHLCLQQQRDAGRRLTNLIRDPAFIDYVLLGRFQQPLTLSLKERKLIVQIIPFENRQQILVTHDVTDSERIDRMRSDFIANASHELRTPLTVINGFLEIALSQPELDRPTRRAHLNMMAEQGHRMQNLIEDMLTLTRLESVDYPMRPEPVNVNALLGQILLEARALSGGQHTIELALEAPGIRGCADELRSAFGNLVSNALRYTPPQGTIRIAWRAASAGPQFVVQDTGIGISSEHIARLTERFFRVDKSRSRETKGTGLGLAIVKHVLLRHQATLAIESAPGRGSTFVVNFPRSAVCDSDQD